MKRNSFRVLQNNYKQVNNIDDANNLSKSISKNDIVVKNNTTDCVSISGSLSQGASGQSVFELQKVLKDKNYYNGSIDGYFGEDTKDAVIKFQNNTGLKATGIADMQTKRELSCSTSYLSLGSKGEEVKQLQNNLIKLGYGCGSCGADGDFGADTKNAVIRFQRDNSLEQDGIVGPATRDALRQALKDLAANKNEGGGTTSPVIPPVTPPSSTSYLSLGSKGEEVKQLQNNLIKLGYSCGSYGADGDFGADTKNAVIRFQRDNSLEQDGIVGPATRDALRQALKDLAANKNEGVGSIPSQNSSLPIDLFNFMDNFKRLKSLADKYCSENHGLHDGADLLALAYIRKCNPAYNVGEWEKWTLTAGDIPADYPEYLKEHDSSMVNYFNRSNEILVTDPNSKQGQNAKMEMSHMIASLDGVLYGSPVPKEWSTWSGDLGQALVDLHTQRHKEIYTQNDYDSLKEYAKTRIIGVNKDEVSNATRFDILDLRGDVDAINISNMYKKEGKPIDKILEEYYSGDEVTNRYKTFIDYYGGIDSLRKKANDTYCFLTGEKFSNKVLKTATIDAFVEKVAELAGMNCNLLCPIKPDDTPVLKPTITIHGGTPINDDFDKRGRKNILPIDPKKEM